MSYLRRRLSAVSDKNALKTIQFIGRENCIESFEIKSSRIILNDLHKSPFQPSICTND